MNKKELAEMLKPHRRETAHHEAGHAVMDWLWWRENHLIKIDMRPTNTRKAVVYSRNRLDLIIGPGTDRTTAIGAIMLWLSGPAAGNRFCSDGGDWFEREISDYFDEIHDSTADICRAVKVAQSIYGENGTGWLKFLRTIAKWTDEAISHPRVWSMVSALGMKLETQNTMTASSAIKIIEHACGNERDWNEPIRLRRLGPNWKRRLPYPRILFESE